MIPKIIHQLWLGPRPLPTYTESWKLCAFKNDWEYRLWRDKDIDELELKWRACYDAAPLFQIKSDIARIEILSRFGGFYFDCDFVSSGESLETFIPIDHVHFTATPEFQPNLRYQNTFRHLLPFFKDSSWMSLFVGSSFLGASLESRTITRAHATVGEAYEKCGPEIASSGFGPNLINASICEPVFLIPTCYMIEYPAPDFPHISHVTRYEDMPAPT
jgi:hypothetical protein